MKGRGAAGEGKRGGLPLHIGLAGALCIGMWVEILQMSSKILSGIFIYFFYCLCVGWRRIGWGGREVQKSSHFFCADRPFPNILRPHVTLKIWSRSPKSNHSLPMFQHYICASLVEIQPSLQEIWYRQAIYQHSKILYDLEKGVKVTKIKLVLVHVPTKNMCKFGQNPNLPDTKYRQAFSNILRPCVTLKIGSKSSKSDQLPLSAIYLSKLGQNPSIPSGERVQTSHFPTF